MEEIPHEWLPSKIERLALADYTKMRRDMAGEIQEKLCRLIPRSRGGRRWLFSSSPPPEDGVNNDNNGNNK